MSLTASPLNIVTPFTLDGSIVRLEPIRREHAGIFWEIAKNDLDNIFQWIPYRMKAREDFEHLIEKALGEQERGESVVFATVERKSGQVIGSTRFMNIDRVNRRVEIGSTWIAPAWHRTAINTEAKYLMLRHACLRLLTNFPMSLLPIWDSRRTGESYLRGKISSPPVEIILTHYRSVSGMRYIFCRHYVDLVSRELWLSLFEHPEFIETGFQKGETRFRS